MIRHPQTESRAFRSPGPQRQVEVDLTLPLADVTDLVAEKVRILEEAEAPEGDDAGPSGP